MTHIIRQQYLHVEVNGSESDGLALQRRLPELCQRRLMPAIERVLDHSGPRDGHLYIERLDIDAGTLTLERLEHDIAEAVAEALERSLREQIPPRQSSRAIIVSEMEYRTAQHAISEAFVYFLTTGSLPWSFRMPEGKNLEQVILDAWQAAARSNINPPALNDAVLRVLVLANVRKRLTRQFSGGFLGALLARLSPEGKREMDQVLRTLDSSSDESSVGNRGLFERSLWETVFAHVAGGRVVTSVSLVGEAGRALPSPFIVPPALASVLERYWPDATPPDATPPDATPPDATPPDATPKVPARANRVKGTEPIPPHNVEPISPSKAEPVSPDLLVSENRAVNVGEQQHPEAGDGIYVDNAGLVLLHPFLPQLFAALNITTEDRVLQPERALSLLHFLTTGQGVAPEYELILPKVLCNMPLATPVESDLELTDVEREEATGLLKAVIRHWEALRNTSPEGLRGAFLLRAGKVSFRNDGDWLLQVESKTYDILLDQLPWGLSTIRLPWMDRILWVEWR